MFVTWQTSYLQKLINWQLFAEQSSKRGLCMHVDFAYSENHVTLPLGRLQAGEKKQVYWSWTLIGGICCIFYKVGNMKNKQIKKWKCKETYM